MPVKAPRICGCGHRVPSGQPCACERKRAAERKARFDKRRPSARKRGYDAQWEAARLAYLAANPKCRRCGDPAIVVDHIQPHKGNRALFWNKANWQPLCVTCHSRAKQAAEARQAKGAHDSNGPGTD